MDKELQAASAVELESKNIEVGEWGLNFTGALTTNEWLEAVLSLQKFDGKIQWYLGDLAVYAESVTTGWGESKYTDLIEATGYEWGTLHVYASVARRFTQEFRETIFKHCNSNYGVSFSHFQLVQGLEDNFADYWLKKAAENGWGVARLREKIRVWKEGPQEKAENNEGSATAYTPTPAQELKGILTWALGRAKGDGAELVRVQVVKNGKVIDEQVMDLEVE